MMTTSSLNRAYNGPTSASTQAVSYNDAVPSPVAPVSITKTFRPYYAPYEVLQLVSFQSTIAIKSSDSETLQRKPLSQQRIEQTRQTAITHIDRVAQRLGFPRRTIATAQLLYHRFHLHFPYKDFPHQDTSLACLLVASKLEDTLKKLREIQIANWQVNNMLDGGNGIGEGDTAKQEAHRPNLISIERLMLQTLSFNFNIHKSLSPPDSALLLSQASAPSTQKTDIFTYIIRLCLSLNCSKAYTQLAYTLGIDLQRTLCGLSYPPSICAAACVWLTSFLVTSHRNGKEWRDDEIVEGDHLNPAFDEGWFEGDMQDLRDISQSLLAIFILLSPSPPSTSTAHSQFPQTSPAFSPSPFSPAEAQSSSSRPHASGTNSERDKLLVQMGIPHTIGLGARYRTERERDSPFAGIPKRVEEWQKVKIAVRRSQPKVASNGFVDPTSKESVGRWVGAQEGLEEIEVMIKERDARDLARTQREQVRIEVREKGLGGMNVRSEEEEREREKALRPGSIRYQF